MQARDYARLLTALRVTESLVDAYTSDELFVPALDALKDVLAESIARLETLSALSVAIEQTRVLV